MITIDCKKKISDDFSIDARLEINKGSFVCLYGRSGSGKTTLLRILAGFLRADSGSIKDGDRVLQEGNEFLSAGKRRIGFLFQDYALFENMSVTGNLLFARNDPQKAAMLLEILELSEFAKSGVEGLSGGQKQRLQMAISRVSQNKVIILDEPTSGLDKRSMHRVVEQLESMKRNHTIIIISHDYEFIKYCRGNIVEFKGREIKAL